MLDITTGTGLSSAALAAATRHLDIVDLMAVLALSAAVFTAVLSVRVRSDAASQKLTRRAERAVIAMIYLAGVAFGGFVLLRAETEHRWGIALAFLPYLLIMQHAIFLRIVRRPTLTPLAPGAATEPDDDEGWWRLVLTSAKATTDRYFGPVSLAVRYGTAAISVLLFGLIGFVILLGDGTGLTGAGGLLPDYALHPAQLGLAGAYVYVLVYLGRRNFTHDVTSGGAMWCAVVLAIGPILAVAIAYLLHAPGGQAPAPEAFGVSLIYFMAGFSPRFIISYLDRVAKKAWGAAGGAAISSSRTLPTTQVAGVTPEIAERLEEEGIASVHGLATADPLRLIRNTHYDRREIVSWIAEAMLIDVFPEHWKDFEREGVTDAIDLVSLVYAPPYRQYHADAETKMQADREAYLQSLCGQLKLSGDVSARVQTIHSVARRLVNDAQLRLIWVLHNHISDEAGEPSVEASAEHLTHT
jgi:hypothetical protein